MQKIDFKQFELQNGLRVIVHTDLSSPRAAMCVLYRVGARDEDPSRTGFAHLFEHLMFGGSKNIPSYDTPLQKAGGENNAYTTNDITNYYLSLPTSQLETGFWLESDRMLELDFSQDSLNVQKSVVCEEFKQRYLNQPYGDAHLLLRPVHYQAHPYRWPTIGKELSHIQDATLDDVREFFYGFYAPNNATLVVCGNVSPETVEQLAQKWFAPIPKRTLKKKPLPQEPPQKSPRKLTVQKDVPFDAIYKAYHIPARTNPDYFAADILTDLLSNGKSSLLFQEMVKKERVANNIAAFSWGAYDPGMISIDGQVAQGKNPEQYEATLQKTIDNLQDISEKQLTKIKNKIESYLIFERTSMLNLAQELAIYDSLGNPNQINTILDIYQSISCDDVKQAAQKYLNPNNCSTLYYLKQQ